MVAAGANPTREKGGSALKRLKNSLKTAGIIGQTSRASLSKKDKKRGNPSEVGKHDRAEKLNLIKGEMNPFEMKVTNTKFEVLGRKVKGAVGKPALTKQVGEDNRKKTLLKEMKNKGKAGGIMDKRFGEENPNLTPEEKMLERFTKEKQKQTRSTSLFNLDDDEENLTHYGQSLANMDDFDEADLELSDSEDRGIIDPNTVSRSHFGGFGEDEEDMKNFDRPKSKAEVMREVIAKSKLHKLERQKEKDENDDVRKDLDDEFEDLRGLLDMAKPTARRPLPSQTSVYGRVEDERKDKELDEAAQKASAPTVEEDEYEDYDKFVRELAFDQRARPSDRTKTEEEIAVEEKEKLEKAEKARKRRMDGLDSEDENTPESGRRSTKGSANKKRKRAPQGDDLDDDFEDQEALQLGHGLTLEDIMNANGEDEDGSEEEGESGSEEEESEEDEDEDGADEDSDIADLKSSDEMDFSEDEMNEIGTNGKIVKQNGKKAKTAAPKKKVVPDNYEVPYTFECPSDHVEFLDILEDIRLEDTHTVVHRICVMHSIKVAAENRQKMEKFFTVIVDHIAHLAATESPMPVKIIGRLDQQLFNLAQQMPQHAASVFIERLTNAQNSYKEQLSVTSQFPDIKTLVVLRTLGHVFPTSDFSHPVATPAMLYMTEILAQAEIRSEVDIGRGLFLIQLLHDYQILSKRFIPEVLNFINLSLYLLAPVTTQSKITVAFPLPEYARSQNLHIKETSSASPQPLSASALLTDKLGRDSIKAEQVRISLVVALSKVLEAYMQLYSSTAAFVETFQPCLNVLEAMKSVDNWNEDVKTNLNNAYDRLKRQVKFGTEKRTKQPLRMQYHRPVPIAQYVPKFEEGYSMDRHYDPDQERAQFNKLKAQTAKERKGAIRELRKDNMFMAREKLKNIKEKDARYQKMLTGVMTVLEADQAEKNELEFQKRKEQGKF
ncbi:nucleolar protein 14 [Umbelopsis sp. AD052]|nr:nucleolar protein 14 [Umbelopsis sp. AD052]